MTKFRLERKITSYEKVKSFVGTIIRGKPIFIKKNRIKGLEYLDIGCGPNTSNDYINLDYRWDSKVDVCWDITKKKLPFEDNSFKGVFTEHCFEHVSFDNFVKNMGEIYRVLKPGGHLRLIMPDGELYINLYNRRKNGEAVKLPFEENYISPMHRINGIFRNHGHQFIYDFETVNYILKEIGFKKISKEKYNLGNDRFLLRDTEHRAIESLYVEAVK